MLVGHSLSFEYLLLQYLFGILLLLQTCIGAVPHFFTVTLTVGASCSTTTLVVSSSYGSYGVLN